MDNEECVYESERERCTYIDNNSGTSREKEREELTYMLSSGSGDTEGSDILQSMSGWMYNGNTAMLLELGKDPLPCFLPSLSPGRKQLRI